MEFFQTPRLTTNQNINYALSKKDTLLKIKTNYFRQIHFMLNFTVFWSLNMVKYFYNTTDITLKIR